MTTPCARPSTLPAMTTIKQEDFIQSVADAFQFISCYHPVDFLSAIGEAYEKERSPAAKKRHRPDPRQQPHGRGGASPDLPGHRHRGGIPEDRHGRALGCASQR